MPTYAYACTQCGHRFDAVQSFSDAALSDCPECGGKLRKQYGSIGVTFNGGGFYRTDSRAAASGASGGGASASPSSSKSEASASPAAAGS
ncbi:FmdB family zinc ribbon protein [Microbacterium sp. 179-B 1A2 NHS]|uniref:FmdB family zinc ribbon protein n=1 Tax=Microbacterium sp. 179-B 1A2 NHS TaxID=3142383 RepID=UPI0039A0A4AA